MWKINGEQQHSMKKNGISGRHRFQPGIGIRSLEQSSQPSSQATFKLTPIELSIVQVLQEHGRLSRIGISDLIPHVNRVELLWMDFILDRLETIGKIRSVEDKWFEAV